MKAASAAAGHRFNVDGDGYEEDNENANASVWLARRLLEASALTDLPAGDMKRVIFEIGVIKRIRAAQRHERFEAQRERDRQEVEHDRTDRDLPDFHVKTETGLAAYRAGFDRAYRDPAPSRDWPRKIEWAR